MEEKLFDLVGLGVPFYLAAATYGVFAWLDNNASDEATQVISSWLRGRSRNKPDLGNLIVNTFDRIYTSPLSSFRAFRRSAAISTIVWLLILFVPWFVQFNQSWESLTPEMQIRNDWHLFFFTFSLAFDSRFIYDRAGRLLFLNIGTFISGLRAHISDSRQSYLIYSWAIYSKHWFPYIYGCVYGFEHDLQLSTIFR
jgi:hypothetical protein